MQSFFASSVETPIGLILRLLVFFLIPSLAIITIFLIAPRAAKKTNNPILRKSIPLNVQRLILVLIGLVLFAVGNYYVRKFTSEACSEHTDYAEEMRCKEGLPKALRQRYGF